MYTYMLRISYIGTQYHGWQIQKNSTVRTIQSVIETTLAKLYKQHITLVAASRTDAGVHAEGQVAHIRIPFYVRPYSLLARLNTALPLDIRIVYAAHVSEAFHAQRTCYKVYTYTLWESATPPPPQHAPYVWHVPILNTEAICQAFSILLGTHDFATMQNASEKTFSNTIKTIMDLVVQRTPAVYDAPSSPLLTFYVQGSGFLRHMVRNIVGALVHIGKGIYSTSALQYALEQKSRTALTTPTAPPQGLCLQYIHYHPHHVYEATKP